MLITTGTELRLGLGESFLLFLFFTATTEGSLSRGDFCCLCQHFVALFLLGTDLRPSSAVAVALVVSVAAVEV